MSSLKVIDELFASRTLFEKNVLNVTHDEDRAEIIHLLAVRLVDDALKEYINFLYIQSLEDFTLDHIVNILFREIANEWIDYAMDELKLSKENSIEELRLPQRVKFIKNLSSDYYKHYKIYIFEKIVDTFIELLVFNSKQESRSRFINTVINSDLIPNRSLVNINSSDQLCEAAANAEEKYNAEVLNLQNMIKEMELKISNESVSKEKRESISLALPFFKHKLQEASEKKLESFDSTLARLKTTMINALKNKDKKPL